MSFLISLAAQGVCCCFSICCDSCSKALVAALGEERSTKLFYTFLMILYLVPAIIFFFFIQRWKSFIDYFGQYIQCPQQSQSDQLECIGTSGIYRLSFSLLIMFFILMILMLCRNKCAQVINQGLFCFKYIFIVALVIAFLWVPNKVFEGYSQASKYISILFMVLQSIILIDLFYLTGIRLIKKYDGGEQCVYGCTLISLTIIVNIISVGLNILGYIFQFTIWKWQGCGTTIWVSIINTVIIILLPAIQCFNFNPQNSLLTTALVSMYVSYLSLIAQFSWTNYSSDPGCQRMTKPVLAIDVIVSTIFFILTMYGTVMGGTQQVKVNANGVDINKMIGVAPRQADQQQKQDHKQPVTNRETQEDEQLTKNQKKYRSCLWFQYHFHMCLISIYIGMLITNWTSASINTGTLSTNSFGFWVRIVISWITTFFYIWTLIAPKICPDRDFYVQ